MDRKSKCPPILLCLLVFLALLFSPLHPSLGLAQKITLGWDANSESDLEGYVVYRNNESPGPPFKYDDTLPEDDLADPLHPMVTLTGLNEKTKYYVAVTAYDTEGNESYFSNEICFEIVDSAITNCTASISPSSSSSSSKSGGGSGGGCFISSSAEKSNDLPVMFWVLVVAGLVLGYKSRGLKTGRIGSSNPARSGFKSPS